jgi:hypothetical protein
MLCTFANLDKEKLEAVQSLEKKIGKTLIAFACKEMSATSLEDNELAQIKEVEDKLGLSIVAIKKT